MPKICKQCGNDFPIRIKINGKLRNLCNRQFCLDCSPFGVGNTRDLTKSDKIYNCKLCNKDTNDIKKYVCGSCHTRLRRFRAKLAGIKYLGGSCVNCNYKENPLAFEFHHRNPKEKKFTIGSHSNRAWKILKRELDKCDLLCANCHRIKHGEKDKQFLDIAMNYKGNVLDF